MESTHKASAASLIANFVIVYVLWGSTYLGIRVAIESFPPLLMAGLRHSIAGLFVLAFCLLGRAKRPSKRQALNASVAGVLMLAFGNGALTWAELKLPTGVAALIVASVAMWLVLLNWVWGARHRPSAAQALGLILGMVGIGFLMMPAGGAALGKNVDVLAAWVLAGGSFAWALGTMYARSTEMPSSPWFVNGIEMLAAGAILVATSSATGQFALVHKVSRASVLALVYLIVFGSIVAFSSYSYLVRHATAARLSTYAYVNPAVAVLLGAVFLGEQITLRSGTAMALILGAVVMLSFKKAPVSARVREAVPESRAELEVV